MCRHYQEKGYCSLYENCYFAHSPEELRSEADPLPNNLPTPMKPISNFKTQLCKVTKSANVSFFSVVTAKTKTIVRMLMARMIFVRCRLCLPTATQPKHTLWHQHHLELHPQSSVSLQFILCTWSRSCQYPS